MSRRTTWGLLIIGLVAGGLFFRLHHGRPAHRLPSVFPGKKWREVKPEAVGLSDKGLDDLVNFIHGSGFVVRHGYAVCGWTVPSRSHPIYSATKPFVSTLLMLAVQEGLIGSVDDPLANAEPALGTLNGGKDASITWRHLACQISGYGLAEPPGAAFGYNDLGIALYFDTLFKKVFRANPTDVFASRIADPLGFQDVYEFIGPGKEYSEGLLAISPQDMARFGLMILHEGKWDGKQVMRPDLVKLMLHSPVPAKLPISAGRETAVLPGQRTFGSDTRSNASFGPGVYSFNWWLNTTGPNGRRIAPEMPEDACMAMGISGNMLWIVPSLDLVVAWERSVEEADLHAAGDQEPGFLKACSLLRRCIVDPAL